MICLEVFVDGTGTRAIGRSSARAVLIDDGFVDRGARHKATKHGAGARVFRNFVRTVGEEKSRRHARTGFLRAAAERIIGVSSRNGATVRGRH